MSHFDFQQSQCARFQAISFLDTKNTKTPFQKREMVFEVFLEVFQMVFKSFLREVKTILKIISENRDIEDYFSSLYFEDLQKMRKFASKYLGRE